MVGNKPQLHVLFVPTQEIEPKQTTHMHYTFQVVQSPQTTLCSRRIQTYVSLTVSLPGTGRMKNSLSSSIVVPTPRSISRVRIDIELTPGTPNYATTPANPFIFAALIIITPVVHKGVWIVSSFASLSVW